MVIELKNQLFTRELTTILWAYHSQFTMVSIIEGEVCRRGTVTLGDDFRGRVHLKTINDPFNCLLEFITYEKLLRHGKIGV